MQSDCKEMHQLIPDPQKAIMGGLKWTPISNISDHSGRSTNYRHSPLPRNPATPPTMPTFTAQPRCFARISQSNSFDGFITLLACLNERKYHGLQGASAKISQTRVPLDTSPTRTLLSQATLSKGMSRDQDQKARRVGARVGGMHRCHLPG